jgi:hypothetical protein
MTELRDVVELPWAADSCPRVEKLRTVLPLTVGIRDSAVQLVSTLGSVVTLCGGGVCGCSAPLTSPQTYTAGFTGDVFVAVAELQRQLPHAPLLAVGVSLGASVLTKYLAEAADTAAGSGLVSFLGWR